LDKSRAMNIKDKLKWVSNLWGLYKLGLN